MKKFYKELVFAILGLFILNLLVFSLIIYPEVYEPYEVLMDDVDNNTLIFADSHGWALTNNNSENVEVLNSNNISNLSYGSDSYLDILFKLTYLIEMGRNIDTIFLSADAHMLGKQIELSNNRDRSIKYTNYDLYDQYFPLSYPEFVFRKHVRKYVSTFDVNNSRLIQSYLESKLLSNSKQQKIKWNNLANKLKERKSKERFNKLYGKGVSLKQINVFKKIFRICEVNNIKVILVHYPLAPSMEKIKKPNEFIFDLDTVLKPKNKILKISGLPDDHFKDQDHVNSKGAIHIINEMINFN